MLIFMNIISKKETFYNYIHLWYHLSINKNELFESQGNIKTYREEIIMMLTKRIQNIKPAATLALTGKVAELRISVMRQRQRSMPRKQNTRLSPVSWT